VTASVPGVYQDFEMSDLGRAVASRYVSSKLTVPHYYLSVELDLTRLSRLRDDLNQGKEQGTSSLTVKRLLALPSCSARFAS
jgi:pyruvate dehydrogenase E2 component (dihydrolipoamide acetyltransferase)